MLNRLISLVFLLSFLNIGSAYSETNFLLPQKKPSIFKINEKQIQKNIDKNLTMPKPTLKKKEVPETKKTDKIKVEKTDKKKDIKQVSE